jgi:hypothetical protein
MEPTHLPKAAAAAARTRAIVAALRTPSGDREPPTPHRETDRRFQALLARLTGWFR